MQRVFRDTVHGLPISEHQPAIDLLHRLLPSHELRLFALPRNGAGDLREWWTTLEGQPQPYGSLDERAQAELLAQCQNTLADLHRLGNTLRRQQGKTTDAALLQNLPQIANTDHLYSINGKPLITHWHTGLATSPPTGSMTGPQTIPPNPVVVPAAAISTATSASWLRRLWPLWLIALLLALLAAIVWWWKTPIIPTNTIALTCPPLTVTSQPPELVIIFDTSASMELNINVDIKEEDWLYSLNEQQRATLSQVDKARVLSLFSRPSRVETAKQSLRSLVMGLPEDQDISLVTFNSCSAPPSRQGPFLGKQHADLLQYIEDLEVDGGTPLATSLEAAASMVDGKNRDAIVVAFLDGEDGCDRNQCEVAARIAEKQPRLTFNVVDISGRGLSDCIAKESGGRIYTARDTTHITEALQQSVLAIPKNTHCP